MSLYSPFWISQILVGIAFCFDTVSFQLKERKGILACLVVSSALIAAHFILLDKLTAGLIVFVSTLRFIVSFFTTSQRWMAGFMVLVVVLSVLTYKSPISIIACIAAIVMTWSSFRSADKTLRIGVMVGTSLWILHNTLVQSPAAIAIECFFLLSNFVGYYRFYFRTP